MKSSDSKTPLSQEKIEFNAEKGWLVKIRVNDPTQGEGVVIWTAMLATLLT